MENDHAPNLEAAFPRDPILEWLHQVARRASRRKVWERASPGQDSLGWVACRDASDDRTDFALEPQDGGLRFLIPSLYAYPPEGTRGSPLPHGLQPATPPTLTEGAELLLAPAVALVEARGRLYDAQSPSSALKVYLLEQMGLDATVHGHDADRLEALVETLPSWLPQRGSLEAALAIVKTLARSPLPPPAPGHEALICRSLTWYAHRHRGAPISDVPVRLEGGAVVQPSALSDCFPRAVEDMPLRLVTLGELLLAMLRLVPVWMSMRPDLSREPVGGETKGAET